METDELRNYRIMQYVILVFCVFLLFVGIGITIQNVFEKETIDVYGTILGIVLALIGSVCFIVIYRRLKNIHTTQALVKIKQLGEQRSIYVFLVLGIMFLVLAFLSFLNLILIDINFFVLLAIGIIFVGYAFYKLRK